MNLKTEKFPQVYIRRPDRDIPALFTDLRVKRSELPEGIFAYDLRDSDYGTGWCTLEPSVFVNHGGTLLLKEQIVFDDPDAPYMDIEGCIGFADKPDVTIREWKGEEEMKKTKEELEEFKAFTPRAKSAITLWAAYKEIDCAAAEEKRFPTDKEYETLSEAAYDAWLKADNGIGIDVFAYVLASDYYRGRKSLGDIENMTRSEVIEYVSGKFG